MKSLGEHLAKRYMLEPSGTYPNAISYNGGETVAAFDRMTATINRLVFSRDGIMVAWVFDVAVAHDETVSVHVSTL